MNSETILEIVIELIKKIDICKNKNDEFIETLKKDYNSFYDMYPGIFQMTCDGNMDLDRLKLMLNMKTNIDEQQITEHDGSVKIGQLLVDDFVKPSLNK